MSDLEIPQATPDELRALDATAYAKKEAAFFAYRKQVEKSDRLQKADDLKVKQDAMSETDRTAWIRAGRPETEGQKNAAWLRTLSDSDLKNAERNWIRGLK